MQNYKDLKVWQRSHELVLNIYEVTKKPLTKWSTDTFEQRFKYIKEDDKTSDDKVNEIKVSSSSLSKSEEEKPHNLFKI